MGLIFNGNNGTDTISATDGSLVIDGLDLGGVGNINAGIGTFSGNLNVGGVLTYEDVKNVDSVGIITARAGIIVGGSSDAGYPNYADNLTIHGTSNEGITIRSGTSHQGALYFSDATGSGTGTYEGFLIYDHSINALTFGTSHVEKLRITSAGKVGINSTTPADLLTIGAGANTLAFGAKDTTRGNHIWQMLNNDASGNAEFRMYKNSVSGTHAQSINFATSGDANYILDGRFGIGTNSPDHIFEVESNNSSIAVSRDGSNAQLLFKSNSVGQAGQIQVDESSGGGTMRFFTKTTGGTNTERVRIASDGTLTYRTGGGKGYDFNSSGSSAGIANMFAPASYTLAFGTNNTERLRIASNGSVGINTTLTHAGGGNKMLNIAAASQSYSGTSDLMDGGGICFQPTDTLPSTGRTYPGIFWSGNTSSLSRARAGIVGVAAANNDATDLVFLTRHMADGSTITSADERMRITSGGKVGINEDVPQGFLHVAGTGTYSDVYLSNSTSGHTGSDGANIFLNSNLELGLWNKENASIRFATDGTERMRIHEDGEVEIKPSVAGQTTLSVQALWASSQRVHIATFGRNGNDVKSAITYNHGTNVIEFGTTTNHATSLVSNNTERLRITSGGTLNIGGNYSQTTYNASITTGSVNKKISFGPAAHSDLSNEGSGIFFSRQNDGSAELSGLFSHSNGGFGIATREDMTFHTGGGSTYGAAPERLRIANDGTITLKNNSGMMMDLQSSAGTGSAWIEFSDTDGTRKGYFGYGSSNSEKVYWVQSKDADMSIYSNGNDRIIVHSNGRVTIGDGNETATAYNANLLVDGGSGTRLTLVGSTSGWGMLSFADASTNTTTQNAGFVYMDHGSGDNGPRLTLGTDNTNRLIIRAPGSNRGQLELYGNFNIEGTPALEINDGGDARKVYMSNSSGDMAIWTRNASRVGGQLKMNESGHMYYHMQDPDNSANLHKTFQTATYKVASGSTNQSTTRTTQYIIAGGYGGSEGMYHGRTHFEVWAANNDHYQPVAFVPMGYNLDSTSFGGHWYGDVWINQGGSQKPSNYGGTNDAWSTMTAQIKWDSAHWNAKPQMSSVVHYVNVGQASIGRLFFSGTQCMWIGWFQPGHYTVQYRVNKGISIHSATSAGGSILVRHSSSFMTAASMAYSSRNTAFDSTIMYGGNGSHST